MKLRVMYCCEFCDEWSLTQSDCENHEATHFGITRGEYLDWRHLNKEAAQAGYNCGCSNNEQSRKLFDEAIQRLYDFEVEHDLTAVDKKPSDFYK